MVGRLLSFWEGQFSGAIFVLGRVHYNIHDAQIPHEWPVGLCAESVTWGSSVHLMKALQNGTHAEALALCAMLLDSGIIPLNHADVAWLQLWMFSLRLCCWNAAVSLWYLGYLLHFFHGSSSINVFFDILLKLRWTAKQQCVMLRVRWGSNRCGVRNGLWWFAGMLLRGSRYRVASVVVRSKGCVKQALRRGLFWIALPILASASLAIVSLFTCLSPRVFASDKGHVQTMKYLISKGTDPNCLDKKGKTA